MSQVADNPAHAIDPVRLALYRGNGMSKTCFFCFMLVDGETDELARLPLSRPSAFPRDIKTAVAGFQDDDGRVGLCRWCHKIAASHDMERVLRAVVDRIVDAPWFQSRPSDEQEATLGVFALNQYAWWQQHLTDPPAPSPGLRFFFSLVSQSTIKPNAGNLHGVSEIFNRDVGLGCYSVVIPGGTKVQILDLASRERGKGYGAIALRKLCTLADRTGVMLTGVIEPHDKYGGRRGGLSAGQLRQWYERFGFQVSGKINGREYVERLPRQAATCG